MTTFQDVREHKEQKVMLHLLSEIERNPSFTQRSLASELGIALGLMNHYLKNCVIKGWIRASQVSSNRWRYFITPDGFREKSHMVTGYLSRSLTFFRDARVQCEDALKQCVAMHYQNIALVGQGDLADIFKLVALAHNVIISHATDPLETYDVVVIVDEASPQATFDAWKDKIEAKRLMTLPLLHIFRGD